jgi:hypothetical protein
MNSNKLRNSHRSLKLSSFLLAVAAAPLTAQPSLPSNPLAIGLAGSVAARMGSAWLARSNPALTGSAEEASFGACFSPSGIGLDGIGEGYAVAGFPLDAGTGIGGTVAGIASGSYRESAASALGALTVADIIRAGAALTLHSIAIEGYGSAFAATLDLGAIASLGDRVRFGATAGNIARGRLAGADLPQRVAFGFAFDLDEGTILSADAWQESRRQAGGSIALSCSPMPGLALRGGIGTGPGTIALGVGYVMGAIALDYGGAYIAPLGLRHAMGVEMAF